MEIRIKSPNAGSILCVLIFVSYIALAVYWLRRFAVQHNIGPELVAGVGDAVVEYFIRLVIATGVGWLIVLFLYWRDEILGTKVPEWIFALFAVLIPFGIYFLIPEIPSAD